MRNLRWNKMPKETSLRIVVELTKQFRLRMRFARCLIWLAARIMGIAGRNVDIDFTTPFRATGEVEDSPDAQAIDH